MTIRIDPEFKSLIPPLTSNERDQLEKMIVADGCREPLTLWTNGDTLIDGHNRYEICERLGIGYGTTKIDLPDRNAAKEWIIRNQLGRRNLSDLDRISLVRQLEPFERERAKERQKTSTGGQSPQLKENLPEADGQTRDHLAKLAGVSGKTYEAGVKVLEKGTPKLVQEVRNGFGIASASHISDLSPEEQDEVVDRGRESLRKTAKAVQERNHRSQRPPQKKSKILIAIDELDEMVNRPFSQVPIVHIRSKVAEVKSLIEKHFGVAEGE